MNRKRIRKKICMLFVLLIGIIISVIPSTAQNKNWVKETISLPKKSSQDNAFNPQFLSSPVPSPTLSGNLFSPDLYLSTNESILRHNPAILNYNYSNTDRLSDHLYYIPFNQLTTYIGLGEYNNIGASLLWIPTSKLSINTSAFISKQFGYIFPSRQISYGAGVMLKYSITDKLIFRAWGQYVTHGNNDPFLNLYNLFPKTSIGADLQYKANQKMGFGIGIEYHYNKKESTWKPESGGKIKIGF